MNTRVVAMYVIWFAMQMLKVIDIMMKRVIMYVATQIIPVRRIEVWGMIERDIIIQMGMKP